MVAAPFELLETTDSTYTVSSHCSKLVIYTGSRILIPSFNEHVGDTNRCNIIETPCGGVKNTNVPDMFPGTVSISGDGCYLRNIAGTYTGKYLSAGKLAENIEIIKSGLNGNAFKTADGITFRTMDGAAFLVTPPNTIVSKFVILNISDSSQTPTITIRCPDSVSSINLYNLDTCAYETVSVTNVQQTVGTVNSYTFTQTIEARSSKRLQVMVNYTDLAWTFKFSNDALTTAGLHNMLSFIAYYNINDLYVNLLVFTETPDYITCTQSVPGNVTQFVFPVGTAAIYKCKRPYPDVTRITSGDIPDCFNPSIAGSIPWMFAGCNPVSEPSATITTYVVPPISDDKILPKTTLSNSLISSTLTKRMCAGEYSCISFVVNSDEAVNLSFAPSDLTSGTNIISKGNIDLKYVKCWWQAGNSQKNTHQLGRYLTPELLLNDDTLVQAWGDQWNQLNVSNAAGKNYLKLNTGEYIDISSSTPSYESDSAIPSITDMPVYDASYPQPLNLPSGYNKQIWVTIHVPAGQAAGTYTGTITIRSDFTVLQTMSLSVEVLNISLPYSTIKNSLYYRARLTDTGSISSEQKNVTQYTAELLDMDRHGISNPACNTVPADATLEQVISLRHQCLTNYNTMFMYGRLIRNVTFNELTSLKAVCADYGINTVYIYGIDEDTMDNDTSLGDIQDVHDWGGKVFCAQNPTQALAVKDVLDLAVGNSAFTTAQIAEFKATGHKIYSYGNPQSVPEFPRTFRQNYGLFLWQMGYDGAMVYAYQHSFGNGWNDFDSVVYRDHNLTYGTANGVIDTIQFEGYREGINDLRYLAALQAAITAHPGTAATTANNWLTSLKTTDLSTLDLDLDVREQMIDHILAIIGA
ncbi:MAG: hypothetical protein ABFD07_14205 [Methanobacterium sp.]